MSYLKFQNAQNIGVARKKILADHTTMAKGKRCLYHQTQVASADGMKYWCATHSYKQQQ